MYKRFFEMLVLLLALSLVACGASSSEGRGLPEPLLVWSWWEGEEAAVLEELFKQFMVIYPEVVIIHSPKPLFETVDQEGLGEAFFSDAQIGLGPDLLIGRSIWIPTLVEQGLIKALSDRNIDTSAYLSTSVEASSYQGKLYGVPLSLHTSVLYYNKNLVDEPPETLDLLFFQVFEGKKIAIPTNFYMAFWGIQAFGGRLFDPEGRLVLDQGGFANWLSWLKNAQNEPNVILGANPDPLADLFKQGEVAYYVGLTGELRGLRAALGEDVVGVAPLPAGPADSAGPLLEADAMMINAASSPTQTEWALRLMEFLTSNEQQRKLLARQASRIPANTRVTVDPRVYPVMSGMVAQTRTAVPAPNFPQALDLLSGRNSRSADEVYVQALAGVVSVKTAVKQFTDQMNANYGFETVEAASGLGQCPADGEGIVQVWHHWKEPEIAALDEIADNFNNLCPGVFIVPTASSSEELFDRYQDAVAKGQGPDLLIGSSEWIAPLAAKGLISNLSRTIEPDLWQQYTANAQAAVRFNGNLYGLPESVQMVTLYYNQDLVTDPARTMDDLVSQAHPERKVALPTDYYHSFWGLTSFGGGGLDDDYNPVLIRDGVLAWLEWLRAAQGNPDFILSNDPATLQAAFIAGEAAYFAGETSYLYELQAALGKERLRVVPLPSGPGGVGKPFLTAEALMLNPNSDETQAQLALEFAKYMAGVESQSLLMEQASHIPTNTNVNVDPVAYPVIADLLEQAEVAIPAPNIPEVDKFLSLADSIYADVLSGTSDPVELVNTLVDAATKSTEAVNEN